METSSYYHRRIYMISGKSNVTIREEEGNSRWRESRAIIWNQGKRQLQFLAFYDFHFYTTIIVRLHNELGRTQSTLLLCKQQSWTILYWNVSIARTYTKIGCFMKKYDLFANNSLASSPNLFGLSIGTDGEWHHGLSLFEKERFLGDIRKQEKDFWH